MLVIVVIKIKCDVSPRHWLMVVIVVENRSFAHSTTTHTHNHCFLWRLPHCQAVSECLRVSEEEDQARELLVCGVLLTWLLAPVVL